MFNIKLSMRISLFLALIYLWSFPFSAVATTYYAAPTGGGSTCSNASPCTVSGGLSKLVAGDTLILKDGTYTGTANMVGSITSGTSASNRTTVRAENIGQAIIDGNYTNDPLDFNSNYVHIEGIHFKRAANYNFNIVGNYNYINNCGFEDGQSPSDNGEHAIVCITEASYTVVEDCWIWGRGRYGIYTGSNINGTNHVIFRRVVVRIDSVPSWVSAGIRFYKGNTNTCQNCIVIDGRFDNRSEGASFTMGGGSSTSEPNHLWKSSISLNNNLPGFWTEDLSIQNTWSNGIIWGNGSRGMDSTGSSGSGTLNIDNMTIGANSTNELSNSSSVVWKLSDSLIQVPSGATGFSGLSTVTNTNYYLAGGSRGSAVGTALTLATFNAGLKYLPRIETGSVLADAGVGANILYQEGITGTYYGQSGWDTTTSSPLWPFANEAVWAAKMKAYTASGPGGNRGFAAVNSTTPLTDYIWGYLGNPKPDIYVASTGAPAPPQHPNGSKL